MYTYACVDVKRDAWSNAWRVGVGGGEAFRWGWGGAVKHDSFLSLKKKLCLNQHLFAHISWSK